VSRKLVVSDGKRDRELQLVGRLVVGRDPTCDISHDHALLSRRHAEFVAAADRVLVRDLGSRNGVFVNGERTAEQTLEPGDIVQIGPLRAKYVTDGAAGAIAPEEMDAERTVVIREPSPAAILRPPVVRPPEPPGATSTASDDEVTRLVRGPRIPAPPPRPPAPEEDDDRTGFIRVPTAAIAQAKAEPAGAGTIASAAASGITADLPRPGVAPPAARSAAPSNAPSGAPSLAPFVFGQVALLAGIVLVAAALSAVWRGAPGGAPAGVMASLAIPAVVAALAVYVVGAAINRRVTGALALLQRTRIRE
jgi:predicted component of type VI protein secretion system